VAEAKTRQRRQRGSINADDIVAGAFEVARQVSLDQLSMPTLAEHLDVGVTSLYWYFRKKDDLLNAMTDIAVDKYVREMPAVSPDEPWQMTLRNYCSAQRRIHREDEILSDLILIRTSTYSRDATRRVFEEVEPIVQKLVDAGFTPDNALLAWKSVSVYTSGSIIQDRILRRSDAPVLDERQRRMTDWSTMPLLASMLDRPLAGTTDEDFEFTVDRLICGLEALLAEQEDGKAKGARSTRRAAEPARRTTSTITSP